MSKEKSCHCRVRILYQKKLWLCYENIQRYQIYIYFLQILVFWINFWIFLKVTKEFKVQLTTDNQEQSPKITNWMFILFKFAKDCCFSGWREGANECNPLPFMPNSESYYNRLIYRSFINILSGRVTGFYRRARLFELMRTSLWENLPLDGHTGSRIEPQLI